MERRKSFETKEEGANATLSYMTAIDLSDKRHMCRLRRRFLATLGLPLPSLAAVKGTDRCPFGHNVPSVKAAIGDCSVKEDIALVRCLSGGA